MQVRALPLLKRMLNTMLQYKISVSEILKLYFFLSPWFLVLYMHRRILELQAHISSLEKKMEEQLTIISNEHEAILLAYELHKTQKTVDPALVLAQNDMIKFYVQGFGMVFCSVAILCFIYNLWPTAFAFPLKSLIPTKIICLLQNYTPFFQTKDTFVDSDNINKLDWLVNILNNRSLDIWVKPEGSENFIKAGDYISKLSSCVSSPPEALSSVASRGGCDIVLAVPNLTELAAQAALVTIDPRLAAGIQQLSTLN
jgi:hypothetical protein